jgi:hypothetical protein
MTTQDTQELFGELRSAAQDQDHATGWTRMVAAIDKWQDLDSFKEQALPYLKESLKERGADEPRLAPASWADAHGLHPAIELANGLDLSASTLDDAALAAAVADPRMEGLTTLRLNNTQAGEATIRALVSSAHVAALRDLSLSGSAQVSADAITMLAEATNLPGLQRLDVSKLGRQLYELKPLLSPDYLIKLHDLRFLGNEEEDSDQLFFALYEFMERTDQHRTHRRWDDLGDHYDDDEEGEEEEESAEPDEETKRLIALRTSVEAQVLTWAEQMRDPDREPLECFIDLME